MMSLLLSFLMKESQIINLFKSPNSSLGLVGIGDDCAALPGESDDSLTVVTTDMLIEGRHFLRDQISATQLARKALSVNLSDIAAMGAVPTYTFLSMAFPKTLADDWIREFATAFLKQCEKYNVQLVGGDTNEGELIVINPIVHGSVSKNNLKLRSTAEVGDLICISGSVGDSRAGLYCLQQGVVTQNAYSTLVKRHFEVCPHMKMGEFLGMSKEVTAMMDVSDGLVADLPKLLKLSKKSAHIQLEKIPVSNELNSFCADLKFNTKEFAALGGEDYVLLFTVKARGFDRLNHEIKAKLNSEIYCIGEVVNGSEACVSYFLEGKTFEISSVGFEHF